MYYNTDDIHIHLRSMYCIPFFYKKHGVNAVNIFPFSSRRGPPDLVEMMLVARFGM